MTRGFRFSAAGLCLLPAFGPVPARAAELARVAVLSAPAPILALPIPLAASSLSVFPAVGAAPSVLSFPTAAPLSAPSAAPALSIAAPASAAEAIAASALAAAPPSNARHPVEPLARPALTALSAPDAVADSGRGFDGARLAASGGAEPVRAGDSGAAAAPRLDKTAAPAKAPHRRSAIGRFLGAAVVGAGAASLAPLLWSSVPSVGALIMFAAVAVPAAAAGSVLLAVRGVRAALRRRAGTAPLPAAPSSRGRVRALRAAGFVLGAVLAATTALNQTPILVDAHGYLYSRLPVADRVISTPIPGTGFARETEKTLERTPDGRAALDRVRGRDGVLHMPTFIVTEKRQPFVAIPGTFIPDSTVALLSRNPVGREVLDGLRDRGGKIHMPAFFISYQDGSSAYYAPPDAITLSAESIEAGGVSVDEFLRSPQAQLAYLEREQSILAHELEHAGQARRSPFDVDNWYVLRTDVGRLVAAIKAYEHPPAAPAPSVEPAPAAAPAGSARTAPDVVAAPIVIDEAELARSGLTAERFLNDAQAQKDYIVAHQAEFARLLHPISSPASVVRAVEPAKAGPAARPAFHVAFGNIQEWEYEAYFTEHFYTNERLKADPAADIPGGELAKYERDLAGFDDFLRVIDDGKIYAGNFHSRSAYYAHYMADMRALWDAHRVEGNVLLAKRSLALHHPAAAKAYLAAARRIAAENGLPAPSLSGN